RRTVSSRWQCKVAVFARDSCAVLLHARTPVTRPPMCMCNGIDADEVAEHAVGEHERKSANDALAYAEFGTRATDWWARQRKRRFTSVSRGARVLRRGQCLLECLGRFRRHDARSQQPTQTELTLGPRSLARDSEAALRQPPSARRAGAST